MGGWVLRTHNPFVVTRGQGSLRTMLQASELGPLKHHLRLSEHPTGIAAGGLDTRCVMSLRPWAGCKDQSQYIERRFSCSRI